MHSQDTWALPSSLALSLLTDVQLSVQGEAASKAGHVIMLVTLQRDQTVHHALVQGSPQACQSPGSQWRGAGQ